MPGFVYAFATLHSCRIELRACSCSCRRCRCCCAQCGDLMRSLSLLQYKVEGTLEVVGSYHSTCILLLHVSTVELGGGGGGGVE